MTEPTKADLEAKIIELEADLNTYKTFMHVVRQKARADRDVGEALFGLVRRYQKQLKEESLRGR
jgi:hypothetical protein